MSTENLNTANIDWLEFESEISERVKSIHSIAAVMGMAAANGGTIDEDIMIDVMQGIQRTAREVEEMFEQFLKMYLDERKPAAG